MSPELLQVAFVVFGIWSAVIAVKAWSALSRREPYRSSALDGGLMQGRTLTRTGTIVKLVSALLIAGWCGLYLAGIHLGRPALWVLIGAVVLATISDLVNVEKRD